MTTSTNNSIFPILRALNSLAIMTVAMSGMYASVMVLEPATREFDIGRGAGALPYTMYMVGFGLGNIILGKWADRTGIAALALLAAFSLPAGLYLASMAEGLWAFVITLTFLCGFLGGAFAFGPLVADISKWFDKRRGLAVGIVISGSYVAGALWPPLLQVWFDEYGWRQSFVYLAMVCAITMLPLSLIYFRKTSGSGHDNLTKDPTAWGRPLGLSTGQLQSALCLAGIGCCAAMAMPQIHIVPHAIDLGFEARDGANGLRPPGSGDFLLSVYRYPNGAVCGVHCIRISPGWHRAILYAHHSEIFPPKRSGLTNRSDICIYHRGNGAGRMDRGNTL
jgi:MFS family permease